MVEMRSLSSQVSWARVVSMMYIMCWKGFCLLSRSCVILCGMCLQRGLNDMRELVRQLCMYIDASLEMLRLCISLFLPMVTALIFAFVLPL